MFDPEQEVHYASVPIFTIEITSLLWSLLTILQRFDCICWFKGYLVVEHDDLVVEHDDLVVEHRGMATSSAFLRNQGHFQKDCFFKGLAKYDNKKVF